MSYNDHATWCKREPCDCHDVAVEIARAQEIIDAIMAGWINADEGKVVAVRYPAALAVEIVMKSGRVISLTGLPAVEIRWAGKGQHR